MTDRLKKAREEGASAVVVSIILIALLGMAALVLDVGRLFVERRELQNGATAAVLAIAEDCARGLCDGAYDASAKADDYIDLNAEDDAGNLFNVQLDTAAGSIHVESSTETSGGDSILAPLIGQVVGYNGTEVWAQATAIWGPLGGVIPTIPIIFSDCEWNRSDVGDPGVVPLPGWPDGDGDTGGPFLYPEAGPLPPIVDPFWGTGGVPPYATLEFHEGNPSEPCNNQAGQDLPGGFGWLDTAGNCTALINDGWVDSDPGASPSTGCSASALKELLLTDFVFIPYFDDLQGTGANGEFHVAGAGAFHVIGYNFGGQYKEYRAPLTKLPCNGSTRCIAGYFLSAVWDGGVVDPTGGGYGISTYQLTG